VYEDRKEPMKSSLGFLELMQSDSAERGGDGAFWCDLCVNRMREVLSSFAVDEIN